VRWLGFKWDRLTYASDFFEQLYLFAEHLITTGHAYVCDLSGDEVAQYRGTLDKPGRPSPYRERPPAESLDLFRRMRKGEFTDGARTLRAKIDMSSPNPNLRDPVLYRILHAHHHRTKDAWCIYPMYDFAHGQCDALEAITHSICTLEFEIHRPLYNWFLDNLPVLSRPRQIEFARLNVTYTVLSKRKLLELVKEGHVSGWDDPRMPTISGIRRRGYTPESLRAFCDGIGVARFNSTVDRVVLENAIRDDLNKRASAAPGRARPAQGHDRELPRGQDRVDRGGQQPRGSRGRLAQAALHAHALDRARGLQGGAAEEVLPPLARQGGAPALRLVHHLQGGQEGRERQGHGARLHLRPRDAPRRDARRPQGEGHHPLGQRRARLRGAGASLRPPLLGRNTPTTCPRASTGRPGSTRTRSCSRRNRDSRRR
jgi:hypothetical protein